MVLDTIRLFGRSARFGPVLCSWLFWLTTTAGAGQPAEYRSPQELAFSPDGRTLAVSDVTARRIYFIDLVARRVAREVLVPGVPTGVVWTPAGSSVWVADYEHGAVFEVEASSGAILRQWPTSPRPVGLAWAPQHGLLLAGSAAFKDITLIDPGGQRPPGKIAAARSPYYLAVAGDERTVIAANFMPAGSALDPETAVAVSLLEFDHPDRTTHIRLPAGSILARQTVVSPDNRWAYVAHGLARFTLPLSQVERGWMNGNAVSIIDLAKKERYATVLLDRLNNGAADPWGVAISKDGATLWVTLAGVHELARLDLARLHRWLAGDGDGGPTGILPGIWADIQEDPGKRTGLVNDLDALTQAGVLARFRLEARGPRGLALSPDEQVLAVAGYYSGSVTLVNPRNGRTLATIPLGAQKEADPARLGEMIFNDATRSLQHWQSCATCHPDGRTDGLNWDLLNDGSGNPKDTRSLLLSHKTPPMMSLGVRANMEIAVASGFRVSLFGQPKPAELEAVRAYLRSMKPEPSPYLAPDGELTAPARRGREIFESAQTGCAGCHPSPLFTDLLLHDVSTLLPTETPAPLDTPTLVELWRTGPYLHHGGAVTVKEVLTKFNPRQSHGSTAHLQEDELDALVAYLLSL